MSMDNFFTSLQLAKIRLLGRQMTMTGTIRRNKSFFREYYHCLLCPQNNKAAMSTGETKSLKSLPIPIEENAESTRSTNWRQITIAFENALVGLTLFMNMLNICAYNALLLSLFVNPEDGRKS